MCLGMGLVRVNVDQMKAFVIIDCVEIMINADVNVKNQFIKVGMMMGLFGILARVNVNMINHVMLNCKDRKRLISWLKNVVKILMEMK